MTKERIEKELVKVREQLAIMQAREKDLEEQKKMAEDAGFCEELLSTILGQQVIILELYKQDSVKNKISMEQLTLLNKLNEHEIAQLLRQKEEEELLAEIEKEKKEALSHEKNEVIS